MTYIGVFDGHDGETASKKCAQQLHLALLKNLSKYKIGVQYIKEKFVDDEINHLNKYELNKTEETSETGSEISSSKPNEHIEYFHKSFKLAYREMDKLLSRGRDEKSIKRWSGASACCCIIENRESWDSEKANEGWIHISNCGDVEAIVVLDTSGESKTKYQVLTTLHTFNAFQKDRDRIKRNGQQRIFTLKLS